MALARLRNAEVIELLATVIANLVEGEFMQLKNTARDEANPVWSEDAVTYYLQKTYLKTASLISKSCRAAALLGGADAQTVDSAYAYGKNLGLAFQLVDDMLDYTRSERELGKPAGADLELGLPRRRCSLPGEASRSWARSWGGSLSGTATSRG